MKNKVIVNGIDVFKDIEYKENLIKDLKDVISKQNKLLELYKGYYELNEKLSILDFVEKDCEIERVKTKIKELENGKII